MVEDLENNKDRYVRISDKIAKYYTPIVHLLAFITFSIWYYWIKIDFNLALLNSVSVLVITCPCALALAIPAVNIIANSSLLKRGILLKNGDALEKINNINTIIFDKTGTLTKGKSVLTDILIYKNNKTIKTNDIKYLEIAASLSAKSTHPLSKAISNAYNKKILDLDVKEIPGDGLISTYKNKEIKLGRQKFVSTNISYSNNNLSVYMKYDEENYYI